ncbi:MAG: HEAT repeat domain-containing protein [Planctomycetota bacterium]|jgi:HEAT repeat protein
MKKSTYTLLLTSLMVLALVNTSIAASASSLEKSFIAKIDELLPGMGDADLVKRKKPQLAFEKICFENSGPGKESERAALCKAIMAKVGPDVAMPARVWLLRKVEPIGGEEVVAGLTKLLHDKEPRIRELARRGLQNNPSDKAAASLRAELSKAECNKWRVGLINALGFRGDTESVKALGKLSGADDIEVAKAAVAALGKIGNVPAARFLGKLADGSRAELRDEVVDAWMCCADKLRAKGRRKTTKTAAKIYTQLCDPSEPEHIRVAALHGLSRAQGVKSVPRFLELLKGDDVRIQLTASRCAQHIAGEKATLKLASALEGASPEVQKLLLEILSERGDSAALPAVTKLVTHSDVNIRIAALDTLSRIGDGSTAVLLAGRAAKTTGPERDAVRDSLGSLSGRPVDAAIIKGIVGADVPVRLELIKAAGTRRIRAAVPELYTAAVDVEETVRVAAILSLGLLALEDDFAKLVDLLVKAQDVKTRMSAEVALTEICLRKGDNERRAACLIGAMPAADAATQASLIRVLAKIGGDRAYQVILPKRLSDKEVVRKAAIRVLSSWKDPVAIDPVWEIANKSKDKKQREQALRGCIRLCRLPSKRTAKEKFVMLKKAMDLAQNMEDKQLVVSAMQDVADPGALRFVVSCLDNPNFKSEAEAALPPLAVSLSGGHNEQAVVALERLCTVTTDEKTRSRATSMLNSIRSHCTRWLYSGPYRKADKKGLDLFDVPFAPENSPAKAEWVRLAVRNKNQPGRFDLQKKRECCGYAKTLVWVDKEQGARLSVGSDDGVKVWLNGAVVHGKNASRGLNCGDGADKVAVTLKKGWNPLMLKITQGGGGWGFCCAVTAPDGSAIKGLKFEAK